MRLEDKEAIVTGATVNAEDDFVNFKYPLAG